MKASLAWLAVLSVTASFALSQVPKQVERVVIRSSWGGLGPRRDDRLEMCAEAVDLHSKQACGFSIGRNIDSWRCRRPTIPHPQAANSGSHPTGCVSHRHEKEPRALLRGIDTTPSQHSLYESAIMNPQVIGKDSARAVQ